MMLISQDGAVYVPSCLNPCFGGSWVMIASREAVVEIEGKKS